MLALRFHVLLVKKKEKKDGVFWEEERGNVTKEDAGVAAVVTIRRMSCDALNVLKLVIAKATVLHAVHQRILFAHHAKMVSLWRMENATYAHPSIIVLRLPAKVLLLFAKHAILDIFWKTKNVQNAIRPRQSVQMDT